MLSNLFAESDVPCCKHRVDSACYQPIVYYGHVLLAVWYLSLFWNLETLTKEGYAVWVNETSLEQYTYVGTQVALVL